MTIRGQDHEHRPHATAADGMLRTQCWCGCAVLDVPADVVRSGATRSCGRKLCDALLYTQVLTAGGEPCDCGERQ